VLSSATTVEEALWLEAHGADAIIAQGLEAGGHRGIFLNDDLSTQTGTFALLPRIVSAVRIPVIAAGGIADATGVAAALALGAAGVQVGTAYMLCPEATTSPVHRAALQSPDAGHTALTRLFTGRPARGIVNRFMREIGPLNPLAPAFPLATAAVAPCAPPPKPRPCLIAISQTVAALTQITACGDSIHSRARALKRGLSAIAHRATCVSSSRFMASVHLPAGAPPRRCARQCRPAR
jgi:NAD(P)H-dependent flavin oxidoreductase YrpB (nitropropane dioxygenase family)